MPTTTPSVSRKLARSREAMAKARALMPGGVNSPVRAYKSVGLDPIVIREGRGCRVNDIDGNEYIDYVGAYGPLILGHADESVTLAVNKTASRGCAFGMPNELETRLAARIVDAVHSIDLVRFVNSGTEATMSAIRLARGATGRDKIVKCIGGYHGHADELLVEAGSGALTLGVPSSPGVPASVASDTLVIPYNDLHAAAMLFAEHGKDIACIIVEPVAGNMGCIPPVRGYLRTLRKLCDDYGVILIFDEVMTGFRVAYGGAQSVYQIEPDLTCLGKIIGGGLPCAAYGGRKELMRQIAPDGPIYQAGTLSGNPLAMAAGLATLDRLGSQDVYEQLETSTEILAEGLRNAAESANVPVSVQRVGSMLTVFFTGEAVLDYSDAVGCDTEAFAVFFRAMLGQGIVLPPSQYECWFVGTAHSSEEIAETVAAAARAFEAVTLRRSG